ncbi:MAG: TetR/AcrR family transcriptional regulator [Eubacteriales bacterium]
MNNKRSTPDKIVLAGKQLFHVYGYKNTTMQMIADKASITKSLLTYHFPKKQFILIKIMGTFLSAIYNFAKEKSNSDPLLAYFITSNLFYSYLFNEENIHFGEEILNRNDRNDLLTYENFQVLYVDIIKYFNVNISFNTLVLREIVIYGSNKEVLNNYLSNSIQVSLDSVIEHITENTCRLLEISDHIIQEYRIKAAELFPHIDYSHIRLFE